jgi:hypothetical protein
VIDQDALCVKATRLQEILDDLSPSVEAARALRGVLSPLLEKAISRQVTLPVERQMPGGYMVWVDGALREFPDVEEAYAQFQTELQGGR